MRTSLIIVLTAFLALAWSCSRPDLRCSTNIDCSCGQVCVAGWGQPCMAGSKCKCRKGCWLANEYFRPRETKTAYCNRCTCNVKRKRFAGTRLSCTKKAWCDLPDGVPLYPEKPACPGDDASVRGSRQISTP